MLAQISEAVVETSPRMLIKSSLQALKADKDPDVSHFAASSLELYNGN